MEIWNWSKKRFQEILNSPENAFSAKFESSDLIRQYHLCSFIRVGLALTHPCIKHILLIPNLLFYRKMANRGRIESPRRFIFRVILFFCYTSHGRSPAVGVLVNLQYGRSSLFCEDQKYVRHVSECEQLDMVTINKINLWRNQWMSFSSTNI